MSRLLRVRKPPKRHHPSATNISKTGPFAPVHEEKLQPEVQSLENNMTGNKCFPENLCYLTINIAVQTDLKGPVKLFGP